MSDTEVIFAVRSPIPERAGSTAKKISSHHEIGSDRDAEERGFSDLTDEDLRRLMLESAGCDLSEFGQRCSTETPIPMASSWMDTKLETMRARSRIWDTPFGSKMTSFIESTPDNSDLDKYDSGDEKFRLEDETDETEREDNGRSQKGLPRSIGPRLVDWARAARGKVTASLDHNSGPSQNHEDDPVHGFKTELSPTGTELLHDTVGIAQYLHACEKHEGTPIPAIIRQLPKGSIDLSHRGLGAQEVKLFSTGLQRNITVTQLNLSNNHLGVDGAKALANALKENAFLKVLILRNNKLRYTGFGALYDVLMKNTTIRKLDLSGKLNRSLNSSAKMDLYGHINCKASFDMLQFILILPKSCLVKKILFFTKT
ncbi:hypothetical protein D915_003259 [Fasciola hepatica]|uniref:Leucine Rich repeat-containing domain protein n=1 Tax=Fasciola hepatica TaxID=6192 RepID=A0A4E0RUX8_FASHE|nr:hypothetical protein D915_003259 [Fasciola hepatica]